MLFKEGEDMICRTLGLFLDFIFDSGF